MMDFSALFRFVKRSRLYHAYRFCILSARILKGVYHSKRLPEFKICYKVVYLILGGNHPNTIMNTRIPPKVGDKVPLAHGAFEVVEVVQLLPPRGEFCFLQATCQEID
jgi:hypothetical protein